MQTVTIGKNQAGQRLDKFLIKFMPEAGNGFLHKMLRKKNITLNGHKAEGSEILVQDDLLSFFFSEETFLKFTGTGQCADRTADTQEYRNAYRQLEGITVLYEDADILIADKPAGILSQKASAQDVSLNEWLIGYLLEHSRLPSEELQTFRPSVCNRLDRNTGGLVLCGKSLRGSQYLSEGIRERTIRKFYRTICVGEIKEEITVDGYLVRDAAKNRVSVSGRPPVGAESAPIRTRFFPLYSDGRYTLLEVELITGKTHQIRAHLAGLRHPLIGDYKYGNSAVNRRMRERFGLEYQLLYAYRVCFPPAASAVSPDGFPLTAGREFSAACPEQFERILKELFPLYADEDFMQIKNDERDKE